MTVKGQGQWIARLPISSVALEKMLCLAFSSGSLVDREQCSGGSEESALPRPEAAKSRQRRLQYIRGVAQCDTRMSVADDLRLRRSFVPSVVM